MSRDSVRLRRAHLTLVALVLAGAAAAGFGYRQADLEGDAYRRVLAGRSEMTARLARVDTDAAAITAHAYRYGELAARGYIGPERRLDLIERMDEVRRARRLFEARYEFSPQRVLVAPGDADGIEAVASAMKLRMPLLHEGDLLGFLDDLADTAPALLRVRECRMQRLASGSTADALAPRLEADCNIDWITLRRRA